MAIYTHTMHVNPPHQNPKLSQKMVNNNYPIMIPLRSLLAATLLIFLLVSTVIDAAPPRPPTPRSPPPRPPTPRPTTPRSPPPRSPSPRPTTPRSPPPPRPPTPVPIDLSKLEYKLSFFWPQGYCKTKSSGCEKATNVPKDFTIHGFWPIYKAKCNASTENFQLDKVKDIQPKMEKNWPDLKNFGTPTKYVAFWDHEWDAHGRVCNIFTVHNYFDQTLKLFDASHLLATLTGKPNTPENVRKVFSGKEPYLLCGKSADGKTTYLQELQFCLDGSQKYVNCPKKSMKSFCPEGQTFSYGDTA